jgi:putative sigma-54 modulation protein
MHFIDTAGTEAEAAPQEIKISRSKRFAFKPMDAQEAVMEMELLNHNFYVFRNSQTDEVNVVYKRRDGEYGLIEPQ